MEELTNMTQEDKELLIKDLSARLLYNVRVEYNEEIYDVLGIAHGRIMICLPFMSNTECPLIEDIKPYLFPLSSMTEEQKIELTCIIDSDYAQIDWYNKNHFDYRGLIEKGIALDATSKNIY